MFTHLHVHTTYSILDGASRVDELVAYAKELGQTALAITDHGNANGHYAFQKECDKHGIKSILGIEFYLDSVTSDKKSSHLIALAENNVGLSNIYALQEYSYVNNFKRRPKITMEMLEKHSEGLIVTSACLGNNINQYIMAGENKHALKLIRELKSIFGDRFYLEIQNNSLLEQFNVNKQLVAFAKQEGIELILTNDVHYTYEKDWFAHEVLCALQTNKKMDNPNRFKFSTQDFWLKDEEEMRRDIDYIGEDALNSAIHNTNVIAERCNARIEKGNYLPKYYDIPDGKTARQVLVEKAKEGIRAKHYEKYTSDIQNEINVIDDGGLADYFLIVQDYINTARNNGVIVGDGRGSGAGSKLGFVLDMSRVDPAEYDLLFERFLTAGRHPDWDADFSDQDAVFRDLQKKYGEENVAKVITFGTMSPKAVSRKVMSAFGHSQSEIKQINSLISDDDNSIFDAIKRDKKMQEYFEKYAMEFSVIERLEGTFSHVGQHAGGVIIYPNLSSLLPIVTDSDDRSKRIVGFDKYMLEELGHWKFDILGLETLPIIKRTLDYIQDIHGISVDLYSIDMEDKVVYDMLCKGDVSGVFQMQNQYDKITKQQPRNFKDLIAINALIRPGDVFNEYVERRNGKPWSINPLRMPYMEETEGLITYQEQFELDCKTFAGWDLAFADNKVRKNKHIREDVELRKQFITQSVIRGHDESEMFRLWSEIEDAVDSGYSFNKSHAACYAVIMYQTAWLKAHYPTEFYASLMTSSGDDQSAIAGYIVECKKKGITILPPDINLSTGEFVPTKDGIRYRITTLTHVGDSVIKAINNLKPILSFDDFLARRSKSDVKQNSLFSLVKAGAFDFDTPNRAELLWRYDMSERGKTQIKNDFQCPVYEWNDKVKANWEKEATGMYLSSHPMERYSFPSFDEIKDETNGFIGGEVVDVAETLQKNGKKMAFVTLSTQNGNVKVLVFSPSYYNPNGWGSDECNKLFVKGNLLLVRGKKSNNALLYNSAEVLK